MDVLRVHGASTVSALAERTDQRVGNVSHHVRALADVGLVEEAPELARDRRERWWRLVAPSLRWSEHGFSGDPASEAVVHAVQSVNLDRQTSLVRASTSSADEELAPWRSTAFAAERWLHLTPDELGELSRQMVELLDSWSERSASGPGREPVLVFAYGVPARP
ncbi:ArsR family transcriptional regulator [Blastococcus sp. TF02-8]|nr:ArsR family transcriptional regulator [Blastococcus sp. TF02-8]